MDAPAARSSRDNGAVAVEVPAGAVVLLNGYLLHMSLPNTGRRGLRRALVNHYMSAQSLLPWFVPAGVTPGRADHRDIVMVAGTDPYAHKGTADVMRPHVRPDGQGGCLR
jgi:phytanoyl-CoA hydroxylase